MTEQELRLIRRVTDLTIALEEAIERLETQVLGSDDVDLLVALRTVQSRSGADACGT